MRADAVDVTLSSAGAAVSGGLGYSRQGMIGFAVMGIGVCKDADIIIPVEHCGRQVTQICGNSFARRTELMSVIVPDTVTSIQICVFADCTSLECVVFSKNVKSIGQEAFRNYVALGRVFFKGTVFEWYAVFVYQSCDCLECARKFFAARKSPSFRVTTCGTTTRTAILKYGSLGGFARLMVKTSCINAEYAKRLI